MSKNNTAHQVTGMFVKHLRYKKFPTNHLICGEFQQAACMQMLRTGVLRSVVKATLPSDITHDVKANLKQVMLFVCFFFMGGVTELYDQGKRLL